MRVWRLKDVSCSATQDAPIGEEANIVAAIPAHNHIARGDPPARSQEGSSESLVHPSRLAHVRERATDKGVIRHKTHQDIKVTAVREDYGGMQAYALKGGLQGSVAAARCSLILHRAQALSLAY